VGGNLFFTFFAFFVLGTELLKETASLDVLWNLAQLYHKRLFLCFFVLYLLFVNHLSAH
jgi:hypothetical protein